MTVSTSDIATRLPPSESLTQSFQKKAQDLKVSQVSTKVITQQPTGLDSNCADLARCCGKSFGHVAECGAITCRILAAFLE